MNKVTKLLSVLLVMGAVGAGTAGLVGCGGGHTHNGTKVEAKDANCLEDGNIEYYTCDGPDCKDKYFKDKACTEEYTEAEVKKPKRGEHEFVFTDKGDGTHGKTCKHGDFTEETEAHVDKKGADGKDGFDNKCDICGAKFLAAGKYYNDTYGVEIEVKADGKVVIEKTEYELSEVSDEGSATFTMTVMGSTIDYTLTKTAEGYELSYEETYPSGEAVTNTIDLAPVPETLVTKLEEFGGEYTSETALVYYDYYTGNYFKINKLLISATGKIAYEYVQVDKEDGTNEEGNTYAPLWSSTETPEELKYNKFEADAFEITALTAGAATIDVDYSGADNSVTFTKNAQAAVPEIPETLPVLADGDKYADADRTYVLYYTEGTYLLNGELTYVVSKETVDSKEVYVIKTSKTEAVTDENDETIYNTVELNQKLTFVTEGETTTITLSEMDGTAVATLTKKPLAATPDVVADGATQNKAECEAEYGYFKITQTGWYVFTATNPALQIYTEVIDGMPTTWGASALMFSEGALKSKAIKLNADTIIAAPKPDLGYFTYAFTATYSETEPEPEYAALTGSSYVITGFNGANKYYVKAVAPAAGTYYVSTACAGYDDRGANFTIGDKTYGYLFESSVWKESANGLVYEVALEANAELKIIVACGNQYFVPGDVTVYFETKEQYDERVNASGTDEPTDAVFTADQQGTYVYSISDFMGTTTYKYTLNANTVSYNYGYGVDTLTYVSKTDSTYTFADINGNNFTFSFNPDGSLLVSDGYDSFTAVKEGSSAPGGDEDVVYGVVGVNTVTGGQLNQAEIVLKEAGTWTLTFGADDNVNYVMAGNSIKVSGGTVTVEANSPVTLVVIAKNGANPSKLTLAFEASSAEEETPVAKSGLNTVICGMGYEGYKMTLNLSGVWTITAGDNYSYIALASNPNLPATEITVTDTPVEFVVFATDGSKTTTFTLTLKSGTGTEVGGTTPGGGQEEQSNKMIVGTNIITKFEAYLATVTFTATEAGTYKFDFTGIYTGTNASKIDNQEIRPDNNGGYTKTLTLAANQTITIIVEQFNVGDTIKLVIAKV